MCVKTNVPGVDPGARGWGHMPPRPSKVGSVSPKSSKSEPRTSLNDSDLGLESCVRACMPWNAINYILTCHDKIIWKSPLNKIKLSCAPDSATMLL